MPGSIALAPVRDYQAIANLLGCSRDGQHPRCVAHGAPWVMGRCVSSNRIARRLGSRLRRMEQRISELQERLNASDMMAAKQEGFEEGYREAVRIAGSSHSGRADYRLKRHFRETYGKAID